METSEALYVLEELGADQWGLVTSAQAVNAGVTRPMLTRMTGRGILTPLRRGVHALPSAAYGPRLDLEAAWLSTDSAHHADERVHMPDSPVVSHASAARVHELGDLIASAHEFTSPVRRQTSQHDIRFHKAALPAEDSTVVEGLPVTSALRTIADLAATGTDLDHLSQVVHDALDKSLVGYASLSGRLGPFAGRYGHRDGDELVTACLSRTGAPMQTRDLLSHAPQSVLSGMSPEQLVKISAAIRKSLPGLTAGSENVRGLIESVGPVSQALTHGPRPSFPVPTTQQATQLLEPLLKSREVRMALMEVIQSALSDSDVSTGPEDHATGEDGSDG